METIRSFFDKYIKGPRERPVRTAHDPLHVATAALLIEMMRMSGEVDEAERARVLHALEAKFHLSAQEIAELLRLAETEAHRATDYYRFTSLIKARLSAEEKVRLIEHLWAIAYVDGELHPLEEHLVRKIADLLHISHRQFIAAKLRARSA
jgi:uncharacterized tellurite resistance protein B-like protein